MQRAARRTMDRSVSAARTTDAPLSCCGATKGRSKAGMCVNKGRATEKMYPQVIQDVYA